VPQHHRVVDDPPEVVHLAVGLQKKLVQVPAARSHRRDPSLSDLGPKNQSEPMPPEPDRLVPDINTALMQQVLDLSER